MLAHTKKFSSQNIFQKAIRNILMRGVQKNTQIHILENRKSLAIFSFDSIGHSINLFGIYEKDYLDIFFEWLQEVGINTKQTVAIDIGANIGNHSLYFSDLFKSVISFEPNHRTYKLLELNAELVNNIICYNCGLSDIDGSAALSVTVGESGWSTILEQPETNSQTIELKTLDNAIPNAKDVMLIKIDVEGHELKAFQGANVLITTNQPIILFEQHRIQFINGVSPVIDYLRKLGYNNFGSINIQPQFYGSFIKRGLGFIYRLIFGESMVIKIEKNIDPDTYTFLIAVPDWLMDKITNR